MLLFPQLTQLDLTAPLEVLSRLPNSRVDLVWKHTSPVQASSGLQLLPTATFEQCPATDVLLVPGGGGGAALLADPEVLAWLAKQGNTARYVTSVCTGALVLGAAGLLRGYRAATHWAFMDLLPLVGAQPLNERVVVDRNRITAGGVTAGLDFALKLVAEIAGEAFASGVELGLEYDPSPPFGCGHPDRAQPALIDTVRAKLAPMVARHREGLLSGVTNVVGRDVAKGEA